MNIDLPTLNSAAQEIGNNLYGPIIRDNPIGSEKLCALNPEWSSTGGYPYVGAASRWIMELNNGEKAVPHLVEIDGKRMIVKAMDVGSSRWSKFYSTDIFEVKKLREAIRLNPDLAKACLGVSYLDYKYIGVDDFASELLNTYITSMFLVSARMPMLVNDIKTYSVCGRFGLLLTDVASEGDLFDVSSGRNAELYKAYQVPQPSGGYMPYVSIDHTVAESVVLQVLTFLDVLRENLDFNHGNLKLSSVLLNRESVNYTYKNIRVSGSYCIKVKNFVNSSTLILPKSGSTNHVKLFNEIRATRYLPSITGATDFKLNPKSMVNCVKIEIGTATDNSAINEKVFSPTSGKCFNQMWWKLGSNFNTILSLILAHSGLPYYRSLDFYVFMVSLMMTPVWYNSILSSKRLNMIWNGIWLNDEVRDITFDCLQYHEKGKPNLDDVYGLLKKYHLSCSATEVALNIYSS